MQGVPSLLNGVKLTLGGSGVSRGPLPIDNIEHVPDILLVRYSLHRLGRKLNFAPKVASQFAKEFNPRERLQIIATQNRLHRHCCFGRRHSLSKPRLEMRMLTQRVILARQKLLDVRLGNSRIADHDGVRGNVSESL